MADKTLREILEEFRAVEWVMIKDPKDSDERINKRLDQLLKDLDTHYRGMVGAYEQ